MLTEKVQLRQAIQEDINAIWLLFEQGIAKRKQEGSMQWQDGYPNISSIVNDIEKGYGHVCLDAKGAYIGYVAVIFDIEPAYEELEGQWLTIGKYACIHRLVVSQDRKIKGLGTWIMQEIENIVLERAVFSIKIDTMHDNEGMLRVLKKLDYSYCGIVYLRGGARQAFEKVLE